MRQVTVRIIGVQDLLRSTMGDASGRQSDGDPFYGRLDRAS
jgi:hypothetical protein